MPREGQHWTPPPGLGAAQGRWQAGEGGSGGSTDAGEAGGVVLGGEGGKNGGLRGPCLEKSFLHQPATGRHSVCQPQPSPWELEKGSRQFWAGGLGAGPSSSAESGETAIGGVLCNTGTFWNWGETALD